MQTSFIYTRTEKTGKTRKTTYPDFLAASSQALRDSKNGWATGVSIARTDTGKIWNELGEIEATTRMIRKAILHEQLAFTKYDFQTAVIQGRFEKLESTPLVVAWAQHPWCKESYTRCYNILLLDREVF